MNLLDLFKIPQAFEHSDLTLWQDDYISSLLLNAHLNPNHDNASRNHDFINDSAAWILNQVKAKSLLDLGCGPGLYTKLFSNAISNVVGVDFSQRSIDYAKETDKDSIYLCENYVGLNLNSTFDVITMIHCEYGSLSPKERSQLLTQIKKHLTSKGRLIFDVFTPKSLDQFNQSQRWVNHQSGFFSQNPYTEIILNKLYPEDISLKQSIVIDDTETRIFRQWTQTFDLISIQEELQDHGLKILSYYDNLKGDEYTHLSETLALVVTHHD